jgi:hypothetical protein
MLLGADIELDGMAAATHGASPRADEDIRSSAFWRAVHACVEPSGE